MPNDDQTRSEPIAKSAFAASIIYNHICRRRRRRNRNHRHDYDNNRHQVARGSDMVAIIIVVVFIIITDLYREQQQ